MQRITPYLLFDKEADEAVEFYVSVFPNSKVTFKVQLTDTPFGKYYFAGFELMGSAFQATNGGPIASFNASMSIMVNFDPSQDKDALKRIDEIWAKLSEGGKALMPLDKYPFSERFGWIEDKYGFSWQLMYTKPEGDERPLIVPALFYISDECEKAEAATDYYLSVFKDSKRGSIMRHPAGSEPNKEGSILFTDFKLDGNWFAAMDGSSAMHDFNFSGATSLMVNCKNQQEIDYYWEKLSAVPEAEQCGWTVDQFGVSWQVQPANIAELMARNYEKTIPAILPMKKIIIADLEKAGES